MISWANFQTILISHQTLCAPAMQPKESHLNFFLAAAAPALQLYIFWKLTGRVEIILNNFMVGARRPADQTRSHEFIKSDAICKFKQLPSNSNWEHWHLHIQEICVNLRTWKWTKSGGNFWIKGAYKFEIWIRRSGVRWVVWWLNIQISGPRWSLVREIQPGESRVGRNTRAAEWVLLLGVG